MKNSEKKIFEEACNGFGFEEIEQTADGIYCTGCYQVHKRPTKMYSNGPVDVFGIPKQSGMEVLCRFQVVRLYNPED